MEKEKKKDLRNQVIYAVFVRNHTKEGTFKGLQGDIKRIKELGVDYLWLLPIYEIGQEKRKGSLGSPYAIKDYKSINPEYGTLADFKDLVEFIHQQDMKVLVDIVFNHTSPDALLYQEHPQLYYKDAHGQPGNRVGDWSDIIDLDHENPELADYLLEVLAYWVSLGVDGFRCDVASLVPPEFWMKAKSTLAKKKPNLLWLGESVHLDFLQTLRNEGVSAYSDGELYSAFDLLYEYDVDHVYRAYLQGETSLEAYINALQLQEVIYPQDYCKLRFLENHDQPRIASMVMTYEHLLSWTAFKYFLKGTMLLYGGQEAMETNQNSLFDRDLIRWDQAAMEAFTPVLQQLYQLKQHPLIREGVFSLETLNQGVVKASYTMGQDQLIGIFNLGQVAGQVAIGSKTQSVLNLLTGEEVKVEEGILKLGPVPLIFEDN